MILTMMALTSEGWALPIVDQQFQVSHQIYVNDDGGGDDYFTSNTTYLARYAYVAVVDNSTNVTVDIGVTDDNGLVLFTNLDKAKQYRLRLYGWHDHNNSGRDLFVRDASGNIETSESSAFFPTSNSHLGLPPTTISRSYDAAVTGQEWINAAAIGSWTIRRRPTVFATLTQNGAQYTITMDSPSNCSPASSSPAAYCSAQESVFLDPDASQFEEAWGSKATIAHEMGHQAQHWAMVPNTSSNPQSFIPLSDTTAAADSDCTGGTGHNMTTKEFQSAAIHEGMAFYIAAYALNVTTDADCRLTPPGFVTWDSGLGVQNLEFSCEGYDDLNVGQDLGTDAGGVEWYGYDVSGGAYFYWDSPNTAHDSCASAGAVTNRAVELDWLRFFWDIDNKLGLDAPDIMDAWIAADPVTWDANGGGVASDDPRDRMEYALVTDLGLLNQAGWDNWAGYITSGFYGNGVDQ